MRGADHRRRLRLLPARRPGGDMTGGGFGVGERVMVVDGKGRKYIVTLADGGEFHTHAGFVPHAAVMAAGEGGVVRSRGGAPYMSLPPTLSDFVLKMPLCAQ